jgi:hypothetical protein
MVNQMIQRWMPEMRTYTTQTQLSQLEHALNIESLQVVKHLSVFALADHM